MSLTKSGSESLLSSSSTAVSTRFCFEPLFWADDVVPTDLFEEEARFSDSEGVVVSTLTRAPVHVCGLSN